MKNTGGLKYNFDCLAIFPNHRILNDKTIMSLKRFLSISLLLFFSFTLVGCQPAEPETIIQTVIVENEGETIVETVIVTLEPTATPPGEPMIAADESCCDVFRIGIFEEPVSLNYWNYLGPGSSVWTGYIVSDDAAHLFTLSDQRFQFVPSLATGIPTPTENEDGTWEIVVKMVEDALWSDGEPITAHDVVFTHKVCQDLQLTWYWSSLCAPNGAQITVEARDDYTIRFLYLNQIPNLKNWQFGIALAPILPQHYWQDIVSESYELLSQVSLPAGNRPGNCTATNLMEGEQALCEDWQIYDDAYNQARQLLYDADGRDYPVAGGYHLVEWAAENSIRFNPNQNYYFKDAEISTYENGAWARILPNGVENLLYGQAAGKKILHYQDAPFNPEIIYSIYGSQEAAFSALDAGDVDYVLNPIRMSRKIYDQLKQNDDLRVYTNPNYNMFYLAFNLRAYPMSAYEFREAFDILIDRELVITEVLGGVVIPLYSTMPATNAFWYNPNIPQPYQGLDRPQRVAMAVQVLKDAGWRWSTEPYWDEFTQDVVPGAGLVMPTGEPMPALTILGPGPEFDIVRATFNQWVSEWARELGMPVQSELTGQNAILDSVFVAADYDMYIFGTPLGNPAYPEYFEEFWHSRTCTFETGGRNTSCFKNEAYDALVDEFALVSDLETARGLVYRMQALLADQRPYIPLYSEKIHEFARQNVVFPYSESLGGFELQDGFRTGVRVLLPE